MCGIAGVWSFKEKVRIEILEDMKDALLHRGPDSQGFYLDKENNIGLVHTRLSIIDLTEKANQPMHDENKILYIVYNGEIYNYRSLKKELQILGYNFFSNSDTEVILKAFLEWGPNFVEKLRGMFVFAIWDSRQKSLLLARDRLGIKPLYYYWDNLLFIFASETRAILASKLSIRDIIDEEALILYLKFGTIPGQKCIYKKINLLRPGSYLILRERKLTEYRYWRLSQCFLDSKLNLPLEKQISLLKKELERSVKEHLIADVPIGVFLSGGVDSSALVSLAREKSQDITTLTIIFPNTPYDESKYALQIANKFNTKHINVTIPEKELKEHLVNFLESMDQPTIDGFNTYLISMEARRAGLKTCLSGLGGDELFGGYSSFRRIPCIYKLLKVFRYIPLSQFTLNLIDDNKINRLGDALKNFSYENLYLNYRAIFSNNEISHLLNKDIANLEFDKYLLEDVSKINSLKEKVSILELSFYMANQLLRDSDVFGMANSVEIRVPFLDHKLIEVFAKLHPKDKYSLPPTKKILILAVENIPSEICLRPKMGFILPFDIWLRETFSGMVSTGDINSLLNKKIVKDIYKNFHKRKVHWSKIWSLIVLNWWMK